MDGKMQNPGLIFSSLSVTNVCILSLARLTMVLKTYFEVRNRYAYSVLARATPRGCSIVEIPRKFLQKFLVSSATFLVWDMVLTFDIEVFWQT